jgi:Tfp pilus assembly protein PilV
MRSEKTRKPCLNEFGETLIEVLVTISLSAVLLLAIARDQKSAIAALHDATARINVFLTHREDLALIDLGSSLSSESTDLRCKHSPTRWHGIPLQSCILRTRSFFRDSTTPSYLDSVFWRPVFADDI